MSLPPGFLDELRTRTSLSQVVGRKVLWDTRKSNQGKGDMWAPCPFHHEKTASFHVDDRKGYYYCFGCHEKGDAISFVQSTENVGFMEAIEILAGEAGMEVPKRDPQAQQKADERTELAKVMEQAVQFFRLQLRTGQAEAARAYLEKRGLDQAALDRFEIGYAPDAWQAMWDHLTGKGVAAEQIFAAGLAKPSQKGGKPYDTFRGRIMFPIRDARGRAIAFGGRAMDPNDNAKYLNSPETLLFDKGRSLYNHGPAREATGKGQQLIVAEGYMDVIALVEGGFAASVAPLGTAITEGQLQLMWRIADEPIIALDGDTAGLRAAFRLIDLALPLLEAGKSLRFALMPDGQDPDDLIRAKGPAAVQKLLDEAQPMVQLLWQSETEGKVFDSPERKAALDKALRTRIKLIKDPSIRQHYGQAIKDLRWQLFSPKRVGREKWALKAGEGATVSSKSSVLSKSDTNSARQSQEAVILAAVIDAPGILIDIEAKLENRRWITAEYAALSALLVRHGSLGANELKSVISDALGDHVLENLKLQANLTIPELKWRSSDEAFLRNAALQTMIMMDAEAGHNEEVDDAKHDLAGMADESITWRLSQAAEALNNAARVSQEDDAQYDTGENGARINREERDAFAALLDQINISKTR